MTDYSHPEHGEMERHEVHTRKLDIDGWKCTKCGAVADSDNADEVFDEMDCEQYQNVREGIEDNL